MTAKRCSPYAQRNAAPILEVLESELSATARVLEIGSGTGQHAVYMASALPGIHWQTSDLEGNHAAISAWIAESGVPNVAPPVRLDLLSADRPPAEFDAVFSANTAHIVSIEGVQRMFRVAADSLAPGGLFMLYGPFRVSGEFNSRSNAEFDRSLRLQDSSMGIRHAETLHEFAVDNSLRHHRLYAMPANNQLRIWRKEP